MLRGSREKGKKRDREGEVELKGVCSVWKRERREEEREGGGDKEKNGWDSMINPYRKY